MKEQQKTHISKLLSLVLRHSPETIGISLDENGWVATEELLDKLAAHNEPVTIAELKEVVSTNSKQRFAFNTDHTRIRANQGHSVQVELGLVAAVPPEYLYHGTVDKFLDAIRAGGLQKMSRQHVHLSADTETATKVALRRGKPVILTVNSGDMHRAGRLFYLSENGVWLTDEVQVDFITF